VSNGGKAFAIATEFGMDGTEPEVGALFRDLDLTLGDGLDILVNNAGILDGTPIEQVTADAFDRSFAVNVRAPFFVLQRALPRLREGGRIINISSAVTRIASPFLHYAMGKGAIDVLSRTLAQQLGPRGITINSVMAGVVDTDMGAWLDSAPDLRAQVSSTIARGRIGSGRRPCRRRRLPRLRRCQMDHRSIDRGQPRPVAWPRRLTRAPGHVVTEQAG
jgi:3-oxoacyl-[acyl-carrier protein] reductase